MKRIILTTISILILGGVAFVMRDNARVLGSNTAYAVGDLIVDWGVPSGTPIFDVSGMAPGDNVSHEVDVLNDGARDTEVVVKGEKIEEDGSLGNVLQITIYEGGDTLYGPQSLTQFFSDSESGDGIVLSELDEGENTQYGFSVSFSNEVGNEYQEKTVVFDLLIGEQISQNGGVHIDVSGNGAGSSNSVSVTISRGFSVIQRSFSKIINTIVSSAVTGGNSTFGNTGNSVIQTGSSNSESQIFNNFNRNSIRFR